MSPTVDVACHPGADGWRCEVTVGEGRDRSGHTITVSQADLTRLDPGASDPTRLVHASFEFLLERESKESILHAFALPVIGRYFPEYEDEIRQRLAGTGR